MSPPRLHLQASLVAGRALTLAGPRAHYLLNVLRQRVGDRLALFNAEDGEWVGVVEEVGRHGVAVRLVERGRAPGPEPGPVLVCAPIKRHRMDWLVEKAVELGVAAFAPVLTERTVVKLDRVERLQAIAVEAAEQCGRLSVPPIDPVRPLRAWLAERPAGRTLLLLDVGHTSPPVLEALAGLGPCDILVGPEGGLAPAERALLVAAPDVRPCDLGPRTLRAETAALAALAIWQAAFGHRLPAEPRASLP